MGNASRRSKQKQQTSKSASPALVREQDDTPAASESVRLEFSVQQAALIKHLLNQSQEAQAQLQFALTAAGVEGRDIVGGSLDGANPYIIVSNDGDVDEG